MRLFVQSLETKERGLDELSGVPTCKIERGDRCFSMKR